MSDEVWIEKGKGRTLSINVRLFKDKIAESGERYVDRRLAPGMHQLMATGKLRA